MDKSFAAFYFLFSPSNSLFLSTRPSSFFPLSQFLQFFLFFIPFCRNVLSNPTALPRQLGSYGTAAKLFPHFPRFNPTLPLDYYSFPSPTEKRGC